MDVLLETLDAKLREWKPETAAEVRYRIREIISLAGREILDLGRSHAIKARADFKAFDKIMKRKGGKPPRSGDELPDL